MINKSTAFPVLTYLLALLSYIVASLFIRATTLDSMNLTLYRFLAATIALIPFAYKYRLDFDRKSIIICFFSGFINSFGSFAWVVAIRETSIASADIIFTTWAFMSIFLSMLVYKVKPSRFFFIALLVAALGLTILVLGQKDSTHSSLYGNFFSFLSAFFYAIYIVSLYKIKANLNPFTMLFWCSLGSTVALFLTIVLFLEIELPKTYNDYYSIFMLAFILQICGLGLTTYSSKKLSVLTISLLSLLQPVFAAVLGFFVFAEHLSALELVGISVTLFSLFVASLDKMNTQTLRLWKKGKKVERME